MAIFSRKTAFITGAARGQGRETALAFAREGANIAAFDVRGDALAALRAEIEALGQRCAAHTGDVRDDAAIKAAVEAAVSAFGRIDILFNNAGICAYAEVDTMTDAQLCDMLDINLKGPMLAARHVVPVMKAQNSGVIINNSSVMGLRGGRRLSHYAASKWGMVGLTKSWAIELVPWNIRVVSVHPTGVNTPMNDALAAAEGKTPAEIAEASAGNLQPMPWIEPEDVAAMVLFLASEKARFITGGQFVVDAGLLSK